MLPAKTSEGVTATETARSLLSTTKFADDVAVPPGPATVIGPVEASAGAVAARVVLFETVNADAVTPLNWTFVVPRKFMPKTVTTVPSAP